MQKKLIATAILSVLSGAAAAQSTVTVYGLIDTGVEYLNHAGANGGSVTRLSSGAMNTSRIGFRGSEDLGGGLKAIFQLENGFKLDTGAFDGDANQLFNRQSNVGLEGAFGRVVAGRSFSTTYDFILPFDPMGYSGQYSWVTSAGATGGRKDGMPTGVSNMVKYQSNFGGFKLGAMYGFGEVAGSVNDSSKYGVGLGYGNGPFSLAATYDRVNGTAALAGGAYDKTSTVHLAGGYQATEALKFNLGYRYYKKTLTSGAADLRSDFYWGGGSYKLTPALTLIGTIYYQNQKNLATDADPIMYSLRLKYALSKRTDLYASGAYAKAKNNQLVGLSRDDVGYGNNQVGVTLGMQHRF
ncbi:porin [Herbaspirillum sp. RV1423]|uniref:porin n=1 Tax=Herbaspirillum sp. RV1423 TaxID=1443993 RepID=UPI0004AFF1E7|nr:porin [Herbaspirillum sp. RV1423]